MQGGLCYVGGVQKGLRTMWTHHPLPDLAYILLGGVWVFCILMATMTFFAELAKEMRR